MADGTTMRERKDALKERYGTRSFKKAAKVRAADEAERDIKMLEMANDPARRAEAAGQLRERYGLQAQEAARQRVSQGLAKAGEATFAEQLAQGALQGAVQGAIGAGTTVATGGIGQAAGLSADMLRAAQGVS